MEFEKKLAATKTLIPGLVIYDLPVHGDNRGWSKENWQREKMIAAGLPDFGPIQNNVSFNTTKGTTRGIHAEPWDKFVSIATGKIFGAWVDLREGESFGKVFTAELDPSKAIFIPRGVGNAYQTLEDGTTYMYLVNDHWSKDAQPHYTFLNMADTTVAIDWPIPLDQVEISAKDKAHPQLSDIVPMPARKTLIIGARGQLGKALLDEFPGAESVDRDTFDIADSSILTARPWRQYDLILNAAAYTAVDLAETPDGRIDAWKSNATALSYLTQISNQYNVTIVHISSDYVFDGSVAHHTEDEPLSPLGVYGQTKAAGDIVISAAKQHYIVRTSWVIGEGKNFVLTMKELAKQDISPRVVNDQLGRLTFTTDLASGIKYLVTTSAPYGTYNLTNDGDSVSWAEIAGLVYKHVGHKKDEVIGITTKEYYNDKGSIAPRPLQSTLSLDKIKAVGFSPRDWREALDDYLDRTEDI